MNKAMPDGLDYSRSARSDANLANDTLHRVGHVLVENALDAGVVAHLASDLRRRVEASESVAEGEEKPDDLMPMGDRLHVWSSQAFHTLGQSPEMLDIVQRVVGQPMVSHPKKTFRYVEPGDDAAIPSWHQDWPEVQGSRRSVVAWVPLLPVKRGEGALRVHRESLTEPLPLLLADTSAGWQAVPPQPLRPAVGDMQPGDVLIFWLLTLHCGEPSRERTRMSCDFRFSSASTPIPENATTLRERAYEWEDVYAEWDPDTGPERYYWRKHRAGLAPYDPSFDHWRNRACLDAGKHGASAADVDELQKYYPEISHDVLNGWISELQADEGVSRQEAIDAAIAQEQEAKSDGFIRESSETHLSTLRPGFATTYNLGYSNNRGDVFFKDTDVNHVGIYNSTKYFTEAPGLNKDVRSTNALTYKVPRGSKKMYVNTYQSRRTNAGSWARGEVGKPYSANFFNNKNNSYPYDRSSYNCSALVWAAYRNQGNDIDGNGGTGVYPHNIVDSSLTKTYKTF